MPTSTTLRRIGAVVLGGSLIASALAAPATAHDEVDPTPKGIGGTWLNDRLDEGLLHASYADFTTGDPISYVDYGGTVEAAYALEAAGRPGRLPQITSALADAADSYITGADFGEPGDQYAGPTGKLLAFASDDVSGDANPLSFGGIDLVARMEAMTGESGRIADVDVEPNYCGTEAEPAPCDYANVFGQIWATRGLINVDSAEYPAAVDFLVSQQCADGHLPTYFDTCEPVGPDATAFFVILLNDYADLDAGLAAALTKATDFLVDWQRARGALADDNGVANANSTGLGGWAFGVTGREVAARKAAVWLRSLQVPGRSCDKNLVGERGAVAYDAEAYALGRRKGIEPLTAGQWQTVAAQALPALTHAPATHVALKVDSPENLEVGTRVRVRVGGLAPGERACVGIGRRTVAVVGGKEGDPVFAEISVRKPRGERTVKVLTANATASDTVIVH